MFFVWRTPVPKRSLGLSQSTVQCSVRRVMGQHRLNIGSQTCLVIIELQKSLLLFRLGLSSLSLVVV
jgi:hypothetical protein